MLKKRIAAAIVVICMAGLARMGAAQDSSGQFRPFNGFFADLFDDGSHQQPQPQPRAPRQVQHYYTDDATAMPPPHPVPTRASQPAPLPAPPADTETTAPSPAPGLTAAANANSPIGARPRPQSSVTSSNYSFQYSDSTSGGPALNPTLPQAPASNDAATAPAPAAVTAALPLHERLKNFRQSPFGDAAKTSVAVDSTPAGTPTPAATAAPASAEAASTQTAPSTDPQHAPLSAPPTVGPATAPTPAVLPGSPTAAEPQRLAAAKPAADSAVEPTVLVDHKSPLLTVETIGPRKIVVGKEAHYEVLLQNSGEVAAEEVVVTVNLPDWAEVAGASASNGDVAAVEAGHHDPCRWKLGRIEAHGKEKLAMKIIPRQSKPFELAVHWDFKQASSQAMIEVQEPKLTIRLDGPREVFYGKREVYKLKLGNSGNGAAENVLLTLMPLNVGDTRSVTHRLGTINAGDERAIEIELTARQAGNLTVRVEAAGDGGSHAELAEHIVVHRAGLQVDAEGPAVQYVGTPANYKIRVSNPGDAPAKNIKLTAKLPTGVKFVSGSDGATAESGAAGGKVAWTLEQLQRGEQRTLALKCTLALSGANHLEITSSANDDLLATTEAVTRVEAMADLRLEINEPDGPVPVGSEASYELHLHNRGTKAAENVDVVAYFSNGVEPVRAEGHSSRLSPGQVVFDLIPVIAPAGEIVLKIKAKAESPGNHVFRAEVHCKANGTRLVREEVTHFYQDGPSLQQAASAPAMITPPAARDESRTADRQGPLPLPTPAIKR